MSVALSRPSFVEIWLLVNMWVVRIAHTPSRSSTFPGTVYISLKYNTFQFIIIIIIIIIIIVITVFITIIFCIVIVLIS